MNGEMEGVRFQTCFLQRSCSAQVADSQLIGMSVISQDQTELPPMTAEVFIDCLTKPSFGENFRLEGYTLLSNQEDNEKGLCAKILSSSCAKKRDHAIKGLVCA